MTESLKLRIVLVEDEPLIAILLEDLLQEIGHEVVATTATEADAVAAVRRVKPDLMIVDCNLQEGTGNGVVACILADGFLPHIFMTGDDIRDQRFGPGTIVLRKPFLDTALIAAIDAAMAARMPLLDQAR